MLTTCGERRQRCCSLLTWRSVPLRQPADYRAGHDCRAADTPLSASREPPRRHSGRLASVTDLQPPPPPGALCSPRRGAAEKFISPVWFTARFCGVFYWTGGALRVRSLPLAAPRPGMAPFRPHRLCRDVRVRSCRAADGAPGQTHRAGRRRDHAPLMSAGPLIEATRPPRRGAAPGHWCGNWLKQHRSLQQQH